MNRRKYFDHIEEKLSFLSRRIERRGKINMLEFNVHSETFFAELCNIMFDYKLINFNHFEQNVEGIDLVDDTNHLLIQVSATCSKAKIQSSLSKEIYSRYQGYSYKFLSIAKDASSNLRKTKFSSPYNIKFDPEKDILDCTSLLRDISIMPIEKLKAVYDFIERELGKEIDPAKIDSILTDIINILSNIEPKLDSQELTIDSFAINEKIEFNDLGSIREMINEYSIYGQRLDEIYSEFDKQGKAKSFFVLQTIRKQFLTIKNRLKNPDEIFYEIAKNIRESILQSRNFSELSVEELDFCVDILIVDAFIRCKIFDNPKGYSYVIT